MITTYHLANADGAHFSPHAWRTTMALAHKGLEHESRGVAFTEIGTICDGERKIVPTIEDGEQVLSDSWAIALHLEDSVTSGRSLFGGEKGKAHALFINNWASFGLQPLLLQIMILELFERLQDRDKAYFRESREKRFGRSLEDHAALADEAKQRLRRHAGPAVDDAELAGLAGRRCALLRRLYRAGCLPVGTDVVELRPARICRGEGCSLARRHARPARWPGPHQHVSLRSAAEA